MDKQQLLESVLELNQMLQESSAMRMKAAASRVKSKVIKPSIRTKSPAMTSMSSTTLSTRSKSTPPHRRQKSQQPKQSFGPQPSRAETELNADIKKADRQAANAKPFPFKRAAAAGVGGLALTGGGIMAKRASDRKRENSTFMGRIRNKYFNKR